jgi:RHS repeat-associated protein
MWMQGEIASYAQGPNIDEPLAMDRSGTIDYYEQDGLGSVTSLTASSGSVAQSYTYDSFGNQTASSASLTNYFRYTGREFDTETNLYYYRARYYDPTTGRFLSEDPLRFGIGPTVRHSRSGWMSHLMTPSALSPTLLGERLLRYSQEVACYLEIRMGGDCGRSLDVACMGVVSYAPHFKR